MSKKLLMLVATCSSVLSGCGQMPSFPTIQAKLVDARNGKIHVYHLPKHRGEKAPYIGSVEARFLEIEKHFCFSPRGMSDLQAYLSKVEDLAEQRCK